MTTLAPAVNIGILVFREGLECILVLAAITAGMSAQPARYRRAVASGAAVAGVAGIVTWVVAVRVVTDLTESFSALELQAVTGLLAIVVLLIVMNWFFHRIYWTRWISLHTTRKTALVKETTVTPSTGRVLVGFALLGFTSLYREAVEVVLFLQSYRLKLGDQPIAQGVAIGLLGTLLVGVGTFHLHRRLPYRRMLVITGVLLGGVLLVMVGEQAQEMQQAGWISVTTVPRLVPALPDWAGTWFSLFPTVETLAAQALAAAVVLGSYIAARCRAERHLARPPTTRVAGSRSAHAARHVHS